MLIVINGETREIKGGFSLLELLEQLHVKTERIAIEHNREIVPRSAWSETKISDGDRLEIVHFVGGG